MKQRALKIGGLLVLLTAAVEGTPGQQTFEDSPFDQRFLQSSVRAPGAPSGAPLGFHVLRSISLPGPLPGAGPRVVEDRIEIPVSGGLAVASWKTATPVEVNAEASLPGPRPEWGQDPLGRYRARALASGWILVQKQCRRCDVGWRRAWKLRAVASLQTAPLVTSRSVYFGAMDNRVYGLKRRNGHRLWATDVGERVSKPLVFWAGRIAAAPEPPPADAATSNGNPAKTAAVEPAKNEPRGGASEEREIELLLVLPDVGNEMLALDSSSGRKLATYKADGKLTGVPTIAPDGSILVAVQKYKADEASLVVLELAVVIPEQAPVSEPGEEDTSPKALSDSLVAAPPTSPPTQKRKQRAP